MASCCSINMRIFKTTELILLLFFIVSSCIAAPAWFDSSEKLNSNESNESNELLGDHYDQRQNGTENYRVHIDGLVVVVAPIEALLLAGGIAGADDANILGNPGGIIDKPGISEPYIKPKPDLEAEFSALKPKPEAELADLKPKPEAEPEAIKEKHINAKSSNRVGVRLMSLLSPLLKRVHVQH